MVSHEDARCLIHQMFMESMEYAVDYELDPKYCKRSSLYDEFHNNLIKKHNVQEYLNQLESTNHKECEEIFIDINLEDNIQCDEILDSTEDDKNNTESMSENQIENDIETPEISKPIEIKEISNL